MGFAKVNLKVVSSITSNATGEPSTLMKGSAGAGVNCSLAKRSSYQNWMSAEVNGAPSDHFMPSRRWKVYSVALSLTSTNSAMLGITPDQSGVQRIRFS